MGLRKIIQIPCHHVLANKSALKLKKGAPLKHFFNINLGIGIIKKLLFCSYFRHISLLLKFRSGELVGCRIKFHIQRVPTRHNFDEPHYPKNKKYLKKNVMMMSSSHFFRYFRYFFRYFKIKFRIQ